MGTSEAKKHFIAREPLFYSVVEASRILGLSPMTLYRASADDKFPVVRVRSRLIVPAQAIEAMAKAAIATGALVDSADWIAQSSPR